METQEAFRPEPRIGLPRPPGRKKEAGLMIPTSGQAQEERFFPLLCPFA